MSFISKNQKEAHGFLDHLLLEKAQAGDNEARNEFINKYKPFIYKHASQVSGRYLNPANDDEISIALIAFNEAIDKYDYNKGISFISFADTVIKRRLIDYYRKESTHKNVIPISAFQTDEEENDNLSLIEAEKSKEDFELKNQQEELKEEIMNYEKLLNLFEINFSILSDISPKHEDARLRAMEVAKKIANNKIYTEHLLNKKELPVKAILEEVDISRKTLERQRKYIIAIVLILINEFSLLKGYIKIL